MCMDRKTRQLAKEPVICQGCRVTGRYEAITGRQGHQYPRLATVVALQNLGLLKTHAGVKGTCGHVFFPDLQRHLAATAPEGGTHCKLQQPPANAHPPESRSHGQGHQLHVSLLHQLPRHVAKNHAARALPFHLRHKQIVHVCQLLMRVWRFLRNPEAVTSQHDRQQVRIYGWSQRASQRLLHVIVAVAACHYPPSDAAGGGRRLIFAVTARHSLQSSRS
mmetsp:Transcript_49637/g.91385  ORF Transcript_49637/g.91385 Transcript_49637/m.91385 type:complete len:220 (-) Transcript_49637:372-1031(-)